MCTKMKFVGHRIQSKSQNGTHGHAFRSWLWPDDLHIKTWSRYSEDVPAYQNEVSKPINFQNLRVQDTLTDATECITMLHSWLVITTVQLSATFKQMLTEVPPTSRHIFSPHNPCRIRSCRNRPCFVCWCKNQGIACFVSYGNFSVYLCVQGVCSILFPCFWLSVPAQLIAWKDSSLKWHIMRRVGR